MAEYGIVVGIKDIKGNCQLEGYKEQILAESVEFGSGASRVSTGFGAKDNVSVTQSAVNVVMNAGKWTAELMQACYNLTKLGDVTITQLAQAVDKASQAAPSVIQQVTLTNAMVTSVSQVWTPSDGVPRTVGVVFEFDKILLEIDKKPADFTVKNTTTGAV